MRFVERGPDIPEELLEARDRGDVVFLCGAGASYPAGMPTFKDLTQHVLDELGTPASAKSKRLFDKWLLPNVDENSAPSFDRIFNQLYAEYLPGEVDYYVAQKLKRKANANLTAHKCLLKLATGPDGKVRLVTTNFDLLFEKAASKKLETHIAPKLPDLSLDEAFSGIVYLHGRLNYRIKRHEGRHSLILSSSDFGRAYLSQGWATNFFRSLLQKYVVVLVGYSANDPPVKYLLQGLKTIDGASSGRLYAFDSGEHHEVDSKWRDTDATPISYVTDNREHSELWDTLTAWSVRADNPAEWTKSVLGNASDKPQTLSPIQRGQVAALVNTEMGVEQFAAMDPPAPADWLCVFDRDLRLAEKMISDDGEESFDPWENFRLDNDIRRDPDAASTTQVIGYDLLSQSTGGLAGLAGYYFSRTIPTPPRLLQLSNWIGKLVDDPQTAWWVSKYNTLHPELVNRIERQLWREGSVSTDEGRKAWENLIDIFRAPPIDDLDRSWFGFKREQKAFGWSPRLVRMFKTATKPKLMTSQQFGIEEVRPPNDKWGADRNDLIRFEVKFTQRDGQDETPPEYLLPIYRAFRQNLEFASDLLGQAGVQCWKTKTLYSDEHDSDQYLNVADSYLLWFVEYLDKVCEDHPEYLIDDLQKWPKTDRFFFNKLRLYVWAKPILIEPLAVLNSLSEVTDESFWDPDHRRELLHLFARRWSEFPVDKRSKLEDRIVNGTTRLSDDEEDKKSQAVISASILDWLLQKGCNLTPTTLENLKSLRSVDARYRTEWASDADDSHEGRSGYVETKTDPAAILDLPIAEILHTATEMSGRNFADFTELKPFAGLIEEHPLKAITALNLAARKNDFPEDHWRTALGSFPKDASERLKFLFSGRLVKLPASTAYSLRHELFDFVKTQFLPMFTADAKRTFALLDALLDGLLISGSEATESAIGEVTLAGKTLKRSRRTPFDAIKSPTGKIAELLFTYLDSLKLEEGAGIPDDIRTRLERMFGTPGEGSDYTICVTTRRLRLLYNLDPDWVEHRIIPWFNIKHPAAEPAWNGYLYYNRLPAPDLFELIKASFLEAAVSVHRWNWGDGLATKIHEFLILACFRNEGRPAYVTFTEAREVLQKTDDAGRSHSIWFLSRLIKDKKKWLKFGKPFLNKAWPREAIYQTPETSRRFISLTEGAQDNFGEIVSAILPFLVPIKHLYMYLYMLNEDGFDANGSLPVAHPAVTLDLLDRVIPSEVEFAPSDRQSLASVLDMVGTADPKLRQTDKWRRLNRIALQV